MKKFILGALLFLAQKNEAAIDKYGVSYFKARRINVAVIDTGIDLKHKDLEKYIWTNEGESGTDALGRDKAHNGVDDDLNGYVDDIHGWNFIDNNNDVSDKLGHGTHIAGIIKEEFVKQSSLSSLASQLRLISLKYYNPDAGDSVNLLNSTKAIEYANKMNVSIINYSGGGAKSFYQERQAIEESRIKNIVFVAAAGNNNNDTDLAKFYPASYQIENMITVAATNNQGELMSFSNYGKSSIDIAAPGQKILSTLPNNSYGYLSGTSQATAFITGHVAYLLSQKEIRTSAQEILKMMKATGTQQKSLVGKTKTQVAVIDIE